MIIKIIKYSSQFESQFKNLPKKIQLKSAKKVELFRNNAFHPSLRLHKLEGKLNDLWSISIDYGHRIIFRVLDNGDVLFISIGTHAIYNK